MHESIEFDPYDEAEILASHLAVLREAGDFDSIATVGIRGRLGELVLTGKITHDELSSIILNT
jgi:hypothetical protein